MKVKEQIELIRNLVERDALKEAIKEFQKLAQGSSRLNEIIIQSARLSYLQVQMRAMVISFQDESIMRSQIRYAIVEMLTEIEAESSQNLQKDVDMSLDDIIRKLGVEDVNIHKTIKEHRDGRKAYICLWIDDNPSNDQIEMFAMMGLGIECIKAKDPYIAYKILETAEILPDIIIINSLRRLKNYENEGIDFCTFLDKHEKYQKIPVLLHSISFQDKLKKAENEQQQKSLLSDLPKNIKNRFFEKKVTIIKDLIEEIVHTLFTNPSKTTTESDKKGGAIGFGQRGSR
jgi:hypothetical protein